jgi:hypothetical protein
MRVTEPEILRLYEQSCMRMKQDLASRLTDLVEASFPCVTEQEFLTLAKQAWRAWYEVNADHLIKPGPRSVKTTCIEAIEAGYRALDLNPSREPLPLGRLVKMICERAPGISKAAARKHARLWERTFEPRTPLDRMARYRHIKHRFPVLYLPLKKPKR